MKKKPEPTASELAAKYDLEDLRFMRDQVRRLSGNKAFKLAVKYATAIDIKRGFYI